MTNLDSTLKSRDNKGPFRQSYRFSSIHVWIWELDYKESWTLKNWCFWTVVLEKTPESPLDCKEIQPVILKEISPEYSVGLMLKLKIQYFGHLMWRTDLLDKTLMLGKIEDRKGRGWQRWLDGITDSMDMSFSKLWELKDRKAWQSAIHGVSKSWTRLSDWTELRHKNILRHNLKLRISVKGYICNFMQSDLWIIMLFFRCFSYCQTLNIV